MMREATPLAGEALNRLIPVCAPSTDFPIDKEKEASREFLGRDTQSQPTGRWRQAAGLPLVPGLRAGVPGHVAGAAVLPAEEAGTPAGGAKAAAECGVRTGSDCGCR